MASPSMALISSASSGTRRWSRVVSLAALFSALCMIGLLFDLSFHENKPVSSPLGVLLYCLTAYSVMCVFWLPCLFIFFRVRGEKSRKGGLALALAMGTVQFFLFACAYQSAHGWEVNSWILALLRLAAFVQPLMVVAAIGAYYTLPREPWDRMKLLASCSYAFGLLVLIAIAIPSNSYIAGPIPRNQSAAQQWMWKINRASSDYSDKFGGIYPSNLAALEAPSPGQEPNCRAAGFLERRFDESKFGYRIEYKTGSQSGKETGGCVGAKTYTITARPAVLGKTGLQNFFMDESGVMRATHEDRAATVSDPSF